MNDFNVLVPNRGPEFTHFVVLRAIQAPSAPRAIQIAKQRFGLISPVVTLRRKQ